MKLGIFSDTHIGRCIPKAIGELRRQAYRSAFTQAIDVFIREGVDYVIHAGDMFERRSMTPEDSIFVKEELQRLISSLRTKHGKEVSIFVVRGNHDGTPDNNALDFVRHPLAVYLNVLGDATLGGRPEVFSDGRITVVGLGYHPYIAHKLPEVGDAVRRALSNAGGLRVVILHAFIADFHSLPPGVSPFLKVKVEELKDWACDLIVCGHYHNKTEPIQLSGRKPTLLTPGSTEAYDLADEATHGVYTVEGGEFKFHPLQPLHALKTVTVDASTGARSPDWFKAEAARAIKNYADELEGSQTQGVLRLLLQGFIDGDPWALEPQIRGLFSRLKPSAPRLLHVEVENHVRETLSPTKPVISASPWEYAAEAFQPLGHLVGEAVKIVEEVDDALEEKRSQRTGLLTEADRKPYEKRWLELFERLGVG